MLKRIFFISLFLLAPTVASADLDASLSLTPSNPVPYQEVVVTLSSYSFDVNVATITWKSGNKILLSGLGAKRLSIMMGGGGQQIPLSYQATLANGATTEGSVTLTPEAVDLIYEAKESYVPPFYEGRSLPGEGAVVRVSAVPSISEGGFKVSSNSLSYNWYLNGDYVDSVSGVGKSVASFALDYLLDETEIKVLVRSPRGNTAEKTIAIAPHAVLPTLYSYDDLLGINFVRAFFRRIEITNDITLSLVPYYLSTNGSIGTSATYDWYLDGLPITPQEKTTISFRPKANSSGTRALTVIVENTARRLQKAQTDLELLFDTRK